MIKYQKYTREEAHDILDPTATFVNQVTPWARNGMIRFQGSADYVFFVTKGTVDGDFSYEDTLTDDGYLYWKTQNQIDQNHLHFRNFTNHDENQNNIHLFYRLSSKDVDKSYVYLGKLKFVSYDPNTNSPVHITWKILDWDKDAAENALRTTFSRGGLHLIPKERVKKEKSFVPRNVDFEKRFAGNKVLGEAGEIAVVKYEKDFLIDNGRPDLAAIVARTTDTLGNAAPFDVESRFLDGRVKYIEVKTTTDAISTNFFISSSELTFAEEHVNDYVLYRIYHFNRVTNAGEIHQIPASELLEMQFDPIQYISRL